MNFDICLFSVYHFFLYSMFQPEPYGSKRKKQKKILMFSVIVKKSEKNENIHSQVAIGHKR